MSAGARPSRAMSRTARVASTPSGCEPPPIVCSGTAAAIGRLAADSGWRWHAAAYGTGVWRSKARCIGGAHCAASAFRSLSLVGDKRLAALQLHSPPEVPSPLEVPALRAEFPAEAAALPGWAEGLFDVEDEGLQLVVSRLGKLRGQRVLDACAGATSGLASVVGESAA